MRMRLGLSGGLVPRDPGDVTPALAAELGAMGVTAVVLHLDADPSTVAASEGTRIRRVLADAGIAVVQTTGYNPRLVHPDPDVRRQDLRRLEAAFAAGEALGAEMVLSGCGSLHPEHFYGPHRDNHTPAARQRLVESLTTAAGFAERSGIVLALECHVLTTLDTPAHIREVVEAVASPSVRVNFDPVNLLGDLTAVYASGAAMRRMWDELEDWYAPSTHVKDVVVTPGLVVHIDEAPPGEGLLDLDALLELSKGLGDGAALIVEHLAADRVPSALARVSEEAGRAGITLV